MNTKKHSALFASSGTSDPLLSTGSPSITHKDNAQSGIFPSCEDMQQGIANIRNDHTSAQLLYELYSNLNQKKCFEQIRFVPNGTTEENIEKGIEIYTQTIQDELSQSSYYKFMESIQSYAQGMKESNTNSYLYTLMESIQSYAQYKQEYLLRLPLVIDLIIAMTCSLDAQLEQTKSSSQLDPKLEVDQKKQIFQKVYDALNYLQQDEELIKSKYASVVIGISRFIGNVLGSPLSLVRAWGDGVYAQAKPDGSVLQSLQSVPSYFMSISDYSKYAPNTGYLLLFATKVEDKISILKTVKNALTTSNDVSRNHDFKARFLNAVDSLSRIYTNQTVVPTKAL